MPPERPPDPQFFVDRSLGRRRVPDRLRQAGLDVRTLAEIYGVPADEDMTDVDWLRLVGSRGWIALMKDQRIRYRPAERRALTEHSVRAFCLIGGNLRADEMAELFVQNLERILVLSSGPGPCLHVITQHGLRQVAL